MNDRNITKKVEIQQNVESAAVTLDAELNNKKKRLVPGSYVDMGDLTLGTYNLDLVGILSSGTKEFKLSFRNAKRPHNGDNYFEDTATAPDYLNSIAIEVS